MSYDYKDLIQKKVYITNPKNIHFALKNMEGVVTSVNVEDMRYLINVKQPDGSRTIIWLDSDEFSEELGKHAAKIVPEVKMLEPVISETGKRIDIKYTSKDDPVNHPSHYTDGKYEVIDFIEDQCLDQDFRIANAVKYISRAGKKNVMTTKQDLEKALWYMKRFVEATKNKTFVPYYGYDKKTRIDIDDYIKEKGLAGTQSGFALEALVYGAVAPAIHILEAYINTL